VTHLLAIVGHGGQAELAQSLIKLCRFGLYFASQSSSTDIDLRSRGFIFFNPDDLSLSKAAFAQGPFLGDSGYFNGRRLLGVRVFHRRNTK
jgi:hypothetical protein